MKKQARCIRFLSFLLCIPMLFSLSSCGEKLTEKIIEKGEEQLIEALFGESEESTAAEITIPENSDVLTPEVQQWLDGFSSYTDQMVDCLMKVKKGEQYMSENQLKTLSDQYDEYCKTFDKLGTELWKKGTESADYLYYQDTVTHVKAKLAEWQTFIAQYDTTQAETPQTTNPPKKEEPKADTLSPEFKKLMDDYEKFFDEYIAFMQSMASGNASLSAIMQYASFLSRYEEAMDAIDEIGERDLNSAELAYYIEVTARIETKLLKILG